METLDAAASPGVKSVLPMNTASESKASGDPEYQVRLDVFEGPLDLLLYLVRREEVEIYELSLERIIQQFLDYLAVVPQPDLDRAGDFIAMAAHLIYLKSRRLLPPEHRADGADEAGEEEDPHWELIRQLIEYKKFKDVAGHLQAVEINRLDLFTRPLGTPPAAGEDEHELAEAMALRDVGVFDLLGAFQRMLRRFEAKQRPETSTVIFEENFTVADKIAHLRELVRTGAGQGLEFSALFTTASSRVELVVTLLALLELVRLKQLRVVQSAEFEEILIYPSTVQLMDAAPAGLPA